MAGGAARVTLSAVTHHYATGRDRVKALEAVDLTIEPGEFVCLLGRSGCGKSTLLSLVAGFIFPAEGRVALDGRPIDAPGPERGVVFQEPNLYPWLDVRGNVTFGPRMRGRPRAEYEERAGRLLETVGLSDVARRAPYELSGGMQQRVAIARVLANDPAIMLMDEPFGALDTLTRERMQDELLGIWRARGSTVLFVTHSIEEAVYLGTRVVTMSDRPGRIVHDEPVRFSRAPSGGPSVRASLEFLEVRERVANRLRENGQASGAERARR